MAQHIRELQDIIARQQEQDNRFDTLISQGYAAEQNKDYQKAITRYREALRIKNDQKLAQHIGELQDRITPQKKVKTVSSKPVRKKSVQQKTQTQPKPKKKPSPSPWSGTFAGGLSHGGESMRIKLSLAQRGTSLSGTMRVSTGGINEGGEIHGTCSGARASMSADGGSFPLMLLDDGKAIEINIDGTTFRLTEQENNYEKIGILTLYRNSVSRVRSVCRCCPIPLGRKTLRLKNRSRANRF